MMMCHSTIRFFTLGKTTTTTTTKPAIYTCNDLYVSRVSITKALLFSHWVNSITRRYSVIVNLKPNTSNKLNRK